MRVTEVDDTAAEPLVINQGDIRFALLGTAHVSRQSADDVRRLLETGEYDAVAVELCPSRYQSLTRPDSMEQLDLFQVLRQGKASMVAASLALGAYQQRLADQFGIKPGAEMEAAIHGAEKASLPVQLVDREIGTTLKRVYRAVPWWQRFVLISGLLASVLSREKITEEEIEHLKEGDMLESTFAEFAQRSEALYGALIRERDRYMALRLQEENQRSPKRNVLVVVGAGHVKGLAEYLGTPAADPAAEKTLLEHIPPRKRWTRAIPWLIVAVILGAFAAGFSQSRSLGWSLVVDWIVINGGLSALGAAIAVAHPLTIIGAFVAAPLTSLNPTIGAGFVTAAIEVSLRRPTVAHLRSLRNDVLTFGGWWRNRVSRTLLVFLLSTLGSAVGTYLAGFRIFQKLLGA